MDEQQITIDDIDVPVSEWDAALVEQAVLHFGRAGREFSTNTFRNVLPEMAHGHIGKAIRNLARRKVIAAIEIADGVPKQVRSTSGPTHGKPVNCYRLTSEGEAMAREQYERGIRPGEAAA